MIDSLFDRLRSGPFVFEAVDPNLIPQQTIQVGSGNAQPVDWYAGSPDTTVIVAAGVQAGSTGVSLDYFLAYVYLTDTPIVVGSFDDSDFLAYIYQ